MSTVTPSPHAVLDDPQREEARGQAISSGLETAADVADLTIGAAELLLNGAAVMVVDATGAVLGATVEAAKTSLGVIGGLADL